MSRPTYHDLTPGDFSPEAMAPYQYCELKLDGLYAEFVGNAQGWSIHGRNGALLRYGEEPCPDCYLRGEMIDGTEWARGSDLYGSFVAWDCIYYHEHAPESYIDQRAMLEAVERDSPEVCKIIVETALPVHKAEERWEWTCGHGWEGLIFRSADGKRYGRMKRVVTQDYVCPGVKRRGHLVTALYGGLYVDGVLETVCAVPVRAAVVQAALGNIGPAIGHVFEAKGNAVLKSGALRHPRQAGKDGAVKWRTDKAAKECRL